MPKLMNRKMYQLCRNLAGRDIQNITELREALRRPLKDHVFYDFDLKVYCFSDGSVWKFSEKEIITAGGDRFSQFLRIMSEQGIVKKRKSEASGNVGGYESTFQKCRNSDQRRRDIIYENESA